MTTTSRRAAASAASLVLALGALGACSSIEDRITERVAEEVIGHAAGDGTKVDIDTNEETVTITSDDGETTMSSSQRLPDAWPASMPLPANHVVVSATEMTDGESSTISLVLQAEGTFEDVVAEIEAALEASPWEPNGDLLKSTLGDVENWLQNLALDDSTGMIAVRGTPDEVTVMAHVETPKG